MSFGGIGRIYDDWINLGDVIEEHFFPDKTTPFIVNSGADLDYFFKKKAGDNEKEKEKKEEKIEDRIHLFNGFKEDYLIGLQEKINNCAPQQDMSNCNSSRDIRDVYKYIAGEMCNNIFEVRGRPFRVSLCAHILPIDVTSLTSILTDILKLKNLEVNRSFGERPNVLWPEECYANYQESAIDLFKQMTFAFTQSHVGNVAIQYRITHRNTKFFGPLRRALQKHTPEKHYYIIDMMWHYSNEKIGPSVLRGENTNKQRVLISGDLYHKT